MKSVAPPKISKVESVNGGVKISWNKSNGAEKYRVYYKGSKGWTRLTDTTSTAYTDKAVSSGKNYTYTVRCISADAKRFTSGYNGKGKSIKYVAAPKISKTEATYNSVKISWGKVNGAEKYRVYVNNGKSWKKLADTTATTFNDKNVSAKKTYTYTVRCINSSANQFTSGYDSKGVTVTTSVKPSVKLDKTSLTLLRVKHIRSRQPLQAQIRLYRGRHRTQELLPLIRTARSQLRLRALPQSQLRLTVYPHLAK